MLDLNPLFEFSRNQCVAICAFLVPANLLATLQTLIFVGRHRSRFQIGIITTIASFYALLMILHVATWLMIGVIMVPTYVLLGLGCTCLAINGWAIAYPNSMRQLFQYVGQHLRQWFPKPLNFSSSLSNLWKTQN